MNTTSSGVVLCVALLLAGCAGSGASAGAPANEAVNTASACPAGTRWLAAEPHVPLAVTRGSEIVDAGTACCRPFARTGVPWRALDAWGRPTGSAEVVTARANEVTACVEVTLRNVEGTPGVVHASFDFGGSPSYEWSPSTEELASLRDFVGHLDALLARPEDGDAPLEWSERTRFFSTPARDEAGARLRFAFVGGRALLLALRASAGNWVVAHLDASMHASGLAPVNAYVPVAILDMTGDDLPEVVFRESDGPNRTESILRRTRESSVWERRDASPGGSTL